MKTYDELLLIFQKDLLELGKLEEQLIAEKQALQLKEIGRHCYEAEETLNTSDLKLLKRRLGISERYWRAGDRRDWRQ